MNLSLCQYSETASLIPSISNEMNLSLLKVNFPALLFPAITTSYYYNTSLIIQGKKIILAPKLGFHTK